MANAQGVRAMARSIRHRGPDDSGEYVSAVGDVALAHRRLSIIDTSGAGHQPMEGAGGEVLVYNGEIYNYLELRRELEREFGIGFSGTSDSEVLLEGYRCWGTAVVDRLRGMFAFVLYDAAVGRVVLARDRIGIKPLYFLMDERRLVFCSELDPLRKHCNLRKLNREAAAAFLTYRYIPGPLSVWEGAWKFPPGEVRIVSLRDGNQQKTNYWNLEERAAQASQRNERFEPLDLRERLAESVHVHTRSDVPAGVLLSGGIDSSTVGALFRDGLSEQSIPAFTIGFGGDRSEIPLAREAAGRSRLDHRTRELAAEELPGMLGTVASVCGEPLADSSLVPFHRLCEFASRDVKVVMGGDGGDELFYGYKWYTAQRWLRRWPRLPMRSAIAERCAAFLPSPADLALSALVRSGVGRLNVLHGSPFTPEEVQELLSGDNGRAVFHNGGFNPDLPHWLQYRVNDLRSFTVDAILAKVDIASMAHGLEVRVPMLDHELIEYAMGLPPTALYRGSMGKRGLREAMSADLPAGVLTGRKLGFGLPLRQWANDVMRLAQARFPSSRLCSSGLLNEKAVRALVEGSARNKVTKLWTLLVLDAWLEAREDWY